MSCKRLYAECEILFKWTNTSLLFIHKSFQVGPYVLKYCKRAGWSDLFKELEHAHLMFDSICNSLVFSLHPSFSSVCCLPPNVKECISCLFAKKKITVWCVWSDLWVKKKIEELNNQTHIHIAISFNQLQYPLLWYACELCSCCLYNCKVEQMVKA